MPFQAVRTMTDTEEVQKALMTEQTVLLCSKENSIQSKTQNYACGKHIYKDGL